jgi:hypothetical protein
MVLHRPIETTALTGQVDFQFSKEVTSSLPFVWKTAQKPFLAQNPYFLAYQKPNEFACPKVQVRRLK